MDQIDLPTYCIIQNIIINIHNNDPESSIALYILCGLNKAEMLVILDRNNAYKIYRNEECSAFVIWKTHSCENNVRNNNR